MNNIENNSISFRTICRIHLRSRKRIVLHSPSALLLTCILAPACMILLSNCHTSKIIASGTQVDSSIVFDPGEKYSTERIPALVVTSKGTLLAFCEGRFSTGGDWAPIDILLRRSTNGGSSWEPVRTLVAHDSANTPTSNSTPIVDRNGTIHLLYHHNYSRAYHIQSADDGKTWSDPVEITYAFEEFRSRFNYNWKVLAPGPGHAIQLKTGRMVVPIWLCQPNPGAPGGDHRPSCIATIFSDDFGKTWHSGDIVTNNGDNAVDGTPVVNPSENVALELEDGRVMLNMRTESLVNRRLISYSADGATHWSKPAFDDHLYEPVCMASLIRLPGNKNDGRNRILFVNPDTHDNPKVLNKVNFRTRENLTAKMSYDEGKTWTVQKVLFPGPAGYSDLAVDAKGNIYCLYERKDAADDFKKYKVVLMKFTIAWLTGGQDH